jgi:ankyrin repeat protein
MNFRATVRAGDLADAATLLQAGGDPNIRDSDGLTPLMIASGLGQPQMVELLLTAGADALAIEPRAGATALHKAALSGNPDVVGLLLDHGAFVDQQSPILGHTPLMDAVIYKHVAAVRVLLERGARTAITNHWQETAIELARRDALTEIVRLIEAKNEGDEALLRELPIIAAVKSGSLDQVERVIAEGADVDARLPMTGSPDDDYTPLAIAAREGHANIVRALLAAGANPRRVIGLFRGTALHEASYFGHAEVIAVLLAGHERFGARQSELEAQGAYNGMSPLHDAVWHGHEEAAEALIDAGHRLDLRTHAGLTARELADLYGYPALERRLAEAERSARSPAST